MSKKKEVDEFEVVAGEAAEVVEAVPEVESPASAPMPPDEFVIGNGRYRRIHELVDGVRWIDRVERIG